MCWNQNTKKEAHFGHFNWLLGPFFWGVQYGFLGDFKVLFGVFGGSEALQQVGAIGQQFSSSRRDDKRLGKTPTPRQGSAHWLYQGPWPLYYKTLPWRGPQYHLGAPRITQWIPQEYSGATEVKMTTLGNSLRFIGAKGGVILSEKDKTRRCIFSWRLRYQLPRNCLVSLAVYFFPRIHSRRLNGKWI